MMKTKLSIVAFQFAVCNKNANLHNYKLNVWHKLLKRMVLGPAICVGLLKK